MTEPFKLLPLPWDEDTLEPAISARTIEFHYHKHHHAYVEALNKLVTGTRYAQMKLEKLIGATAKADAEAEKKIFNNAAQVWNHDFYWRSLSPGPDGPRGDLKKAIGRDVGDTNQLIKTLARAGKEQFGSG